MQILSGLKNAQFFFFFLSDQSQAEPPEPKRDMRNSGFMSEVLTLKKISNYYKSCK